MKIHQGKIIEATRDELFSYYLSRELDDVYSFPDYLERMKDAGVNIIDESSTDSMKMETIDSKAFKAREVDRQLPQKHQTPDACWSDWFKKGYQRAIDDVRKLIVEHEEEVYIGVVEDILKLNS